MRSAFTRNSAIASKLIGTLSVAAAGLFATASAAANVTSPQLMPNLALLLVQMVAIIVCARLVGLMFRGIGQPQVVGEMAAGIALGPTLLGALAPGLSMALFPPQTMGFLHAISQIGLVIFMFLTRIDPHRDRVAGAELRGAQ